MPFFRKVCIAFLSLTLLFSACTSSIPSETSTRTPPPNATPVANAQVSTPVPAVSSLQVEKEALRGVQVKLWHPSVALPR